MFGLRAMFFVLKDLVDYFELLKYGLCIILVFIGGELILSPFIHLDTATVLVVISSVFVVTLTASTAKKCWVPEVTGSEEGKSPDRRLNVSSPSFSNTCDQAM